MLSFEGVGGDDLIYGGSLAELDTDVNGKNIILGQQGSDTIYGGSGDDDIYGGHNVANGADAGDFIDAGAGDDVVLGDNGRIERTSDDVGPRFRALSGTIIYNDNGQAQIHTADSADTADAANPAEVEAREIELYDHTGHATDNAGNYGDDVVAGGADDDVIFGQLGDDQIHGDGRLDGDGADVIGMTAADGTDAQVSTASKLVDLSGTTPATAPDLSGVYSR